MATQFYAIGYVNRGVKTHAVTADGPLCGSTRLNRFRAVLPHTPITCQRCHAALKHGNFHYDPNAVPVALRQIKMP